MKKPNCTLKNAFMRAAGLLTCIAMLSACFDSGPSAQLSAHYILAPVDGGSCSLLNLAGKTIAGPASTKAGLALLEFPADAGMAQLACQGGSYIDEATGVPTPGIPLRSYVNLGMHNLTAMATPLTELTVRTLGTRDPAVHYTALSAAVAGAFAFQSAGQLCRRRIRGHIHRRARSDLPMGGQTQGRHVGVRSALRARVSAHQCGFGYGERLYQHGHLSWCDGRVAAAGLLLRHRARDDSVERLDLVMNTLLTILQDHGLAAVPAVGFAMIFNVPKPALKYCAIAGALGHALRFGLYKISLFGIGPLPIEWATLIAACAVSVIGIYWAQKWRAHPKVFTVAAIIPMIPGVYSFTALLALVDMERKGFSQELLRIAIDNGLKAFFIIAALAVGLAMPGLIFYRRKPVV